MVTQVIKKLILSSAVIFFCIPVLGQKKSQSAPFVIVSDIKKKHFYPGDTISFTIKNKTQTTRGYTIEAINIRTDSKSRSAYSDVYTAYFNNDTSFFRKLKTSQQKAKSDKVGYVMPDAQTVPHTINANDISSFVFIIHGKKSKSSIRIKLRVVPDIINDEPEFLIETKTFDVFVSVM